ncbi:hypothetical protein QTP88_026713 [Uroleucon formosanum]
MSGRDRDKYRSRPPGHQKRIKKLVKEEFLNKQRVEDPVEETFKITYDRSDIQREHPAYSLSETMEISTSPSKLIKLSHTPEEENHSSTAENKIRFPVDDSVDATFKINLHRIDIQEIDLRDPASWTEGLSQHLRDEIIKIGPVRVINIDYPLHTIQNTTRKFSNKYYYRTLSNDLRQSQLATNGTNDWKHMSDNLKVHERSKPHIIAAQKWNELKTRISKSQTIDKVQQIVIEKEKTHWKNVMIRIISVIHYLAKHNSSFRGFTDVLYEKNNGKFLGLIEMLDFTNIHDSTGLYLSDVLVEKLKIYGISLNDCRAQGYDNGANMIRQYKSVQARILKQNPRAFFVPCAAHRLNLVLGDTAKSPVRAVHFFGTVERLYTLFSASTGKWDIFSRHCHKWIVKKWSETRWESRYDSIKAIRFQVKEIIDALDKISDETRDPLIRSETNSLIAEIRSLEFLMSLCIWYTVLCEVNIVSKSLQGPDVNLDISSELLNGFIKFLTN